MSTTTMPPPRWLHGLDPEGVERLARIREPGCVSLSVPASPLPGETDLARIELGNRLREAVGRLESARVDGTVIGPIVAAVNGMLEDPAFWRHQWHGLAVLVPTASVPGGGPVAAILRYATGTARGLSARGLTS